MITLILLINLVMYIAESEDLDGSMASSWEHYGKKLY